MPMLFKGPNHSGIQSELRQGVPVVGSASYEETWHKYWNKIGTPPGSFNERMLLHINTLYRTSFSNLSDALQVIAEQNGFPSWSAASGVSREPRFYDVYWTDEIVWSSSLPLNWRDDTVHRLLWDVLSTRWTLDLEWRA